jgi:histidine triad (HIT) family protein
MVPPQVSKGFTNGKHLLIAERAASVPLCTSSARRSNKIMSGRECVFCKIVAGSSPSQEIYQDDATLSFMDIHPANDGHCLVIPKMHFETVMDMSSDAFAAVARTVTKIARAVNDALQPGGISLVQANGELAGQTVPHVHVHVLPRRTSDDLLLNWDRDRTDQNKADSTRIAEIAIRLRSRLRS